MFARMAMCEAAAPPPAPKTLPDRVVSRFAPIVSFHPSERHFPCSAEWYFERSKLTFRHDGISGAAHPICVATAVSASNNVALEDVSVQMEWSTDKVGAPTRGLSRVPMYASVRKCVSVANMKELLFWEITYMMLYPYNNGVSLMCGLARPGSHDGDWEHVTVRVSAHDHKLLAIRYGAHRMHEGTWVKFDPSAQLDPDKSHHRPVMYAALGGHGLYPAPGVTWRALGFANDYTKSGGMVWDPVCVLRRVSETAQHIVVAMTEEAIDVQGATARPEERQGVVPNYPQVLQEAQVWHRYNGLWGTAESPHLQGWFGRSENPRTLTRLQRLFMLR